MQKDLTGEQGTSGAVAPGTEDAAYALTKSRACWDDPVPRFQSRHTTPDLQHFPDTFIPSHSWQRGENGVGPCREAGGELWSLSYPSPPHPSSWLQTLRDTLLGASRKNQYAKKDAAGTLPWIILMSAGLMGAANILTWTSESPSLATSRSFSLNRETQRKRALIQAWLMPSAPWFKLGRDACITYTRH